MVNPRFTDIIVTKDETKYRKREFPEISKVVNKNPLCTSCNKSVKLNVINGKALVHPQLQTLLCEKCHNFYGNGEFSVDEDGSDKYCRWCGQGGTIFQCSKCVAGFCKKCIKRNLTRAILDEVDRDDWLCFVCNVEPLWELRAMAWAALKHSENIKPPPSAASKVATESKPRVSPHLTKHVRMVTNDLHTIVGDIQTFGKELKKECDRIYDDKCRKKVIAEALSKEEEAADAILALLKNSQDQLKGIQDKLDGFYKVWTVSREELQAKAQKDSLTTNETVSTTSEIAPAPSDDSPTSPPEPEGEKVQASPQKDSLPTKESISSSSETAPTQSDDPPHNNSSENEEEKCEEGKPEVKEEDIDNTVGQNEDSDKNDTTAETNVEKDEEISREKKRKRSEELDSNNVDDTNHEESSTVSQKKIKILPSKLPEKEDQSEENGNLDDVHMESENGTSQELVEAV